VGPTGSIVGSVEANPLPFNYPYVVTLTVTNPTGSVLATKTGTLFSPKPRD
jgi:hypothetical protein